MKARVSNLHKQEAAWRQFSNWVPNAGEIVVYDPDERYTYSRLKIGDGVHTLQELEFLIDKAALALIQKQHYFEIIDSGRVTDYKN